MDWTAILFGEPTVPSLFCVDTMLPALGLLFAGLFCLYGSSPAHGRLGMTSLMMRSILVWTSIILLTVIPSAPAATYRLCSNIERH